jgi:hypothetical protein
MRNLLISFGMVAAVLSVPAFAQSSGPGGSAPDISRSDMSAHDYASQPKDLYDVRNQLRNEEAMKQAQAAQGKLGHARPAKAAELVVGATINDKTGLAIAKIDKVDPDGIIIAAGTAKVKVPTDAFGHNNGGLLLDMTKAQFDQVVAQANTTH